MPAIRVLERPLFFGGFATEVGRSRLGDSESRLGKWMGVMCELAGQVDFSSAGVRMKDGIGGTGGGGVRDFGDGGGDICGVRERVR